MQEISGKSFPGVAPGEWIHVARQLFNERKGKPAPGYDAALAKAFSVLDGPIPPLSAAVRSPEARAVLVLRGQHSDILTQETVDEIAAAIRTLTAVTIAGQGHAPSLRARRIDRGYQPFSGLDRDKRRPCCELRLPLDPRSSTQLKGAAMRRSASARSSAVMRGQTGLGPPPQNVLRRRSPLVSLEVRNLLVR